MESICIIQPDDWHLHLRDGELLQDTVAASARCFKRAIVMPNLAPPVRNKAQALAYRQRILSVSKPGFCPLMTLYLTPETTPEMIEQAVSKEIPAAKLYPAGATTNSADGVISIEHLYPVFERMMEVGMKLLIHGEVTDAKTDIFDREKAFISQYLMPLVDRFSNLKVVFEHITTSDAVEFVLQASDFVAATITPQHLLMNRNDLLAGGIRPHNYCLPILKRSSHQLALQEAAISGNSKFFLGTDSAPHLQTMKETACGCAGCYTAGNAIELYAQVFDELGAIDKLENFASYYGAQFYGLPINTDTITLIKQTWQVPELIKLTSGDLIVPFYAGQTLNWKLQTAKETWTMSDVYPGKPA